MNCSEAREAMLIAGTRELEGVGDAPLANHLRECSACGARAEFVTRGLHSLSAQITSAGARRARRARRLVLAAALPIAAGLVAVVVLRTRDRTPAPRMHPVDVVSVEVAPGQQATVFKTRDPKVTVVWLSSGGGAP